MSTRLQPGLEFGIGRRRRQENVAPGFSRVEPRGRSLSPRKRATEFPIAIRVTLSRPPSRPHRPATRLPRAEPGATLWDAPSRATMGRRGTPPDQPPGRTAVPYAFTAAVMTCEGAMGGEGRHGWATHGANRRTREGASPNLAPGSARGTSASLSCDREGGRPKIDRDAFLSPALRAHLTAAFFHPAEAGC